MAAADQRLLAELDQPLQAVLADGLQHSESRVCIECVDSTDQVVLDKCGKCVDGIDPELLVGIHDRLDRVQVRAAGKYGLAGEHPAVLPVEQLIAPLDGAS